jgi:2-polyprenyl-6-hydroxyphenyl methylase/3-demethylubiquinone-9 3-methyltransferase
VPEPNRVIQHLQKYLKPQGVFIYHTLNQTPICWLVYLQIAPRLIANSPEHVHIYDYCVKPSSMSLWLKQSGFGSHQQIGIRPKLNPKLLWRLLTRRKLETVMPFEYCGNLWLGYLGHALLESTESP